MGLPSQHATGSGVSRCARPILTQSAGARCCVTLLCKQGTGGWQGFSTRAVLPAVFPTFPLMQPGGGPSQGLLVCFPGGIAVVATRAVSRRALLVEGLSLC